MFVDYRLDFDPTEGAFWLCHRGERLLLPAAMNAEVEGFVSRATALAAAFKAMNDACEAVDTPRTAHG